MTRPLDLPDLSAGHGSDGLGYGTEGSKAILRPVESQGRHLDVLKRIPGKVASGSDVGQGALGAQTLGIPGGEQHFTEGMTGSGIGRS